MSMMPLFASSSSSGSRSSSDGKGSDESAGRFSLRNADLRRLPFLWQIAGVLISVGGFVTGTNSLADMALHLSILSFATAAYLSLFIRDRRRPQDLVAVLGYLLYAAGFALLSLPSRWTFGDWTPAAYALGTLFIGLLLPLTWWLFVEHLVE